MWRNLEGRDLRFWTPGGSVRHRQPHIQTRRAATSTTSTIASRRKNENPPSPSSLSSSAHLDPAIPLPSTTTLAKHPRCSVMISLDMVVMLLLMVVEIKLEVRLASKQLRHLSTSSLSSSRTLTQSPNAHFWSLAWR